MPQALSTTKRKFFSILESISNPSSTSLDFQNQHNNASTTTLTAATLDEPSAKKLKFTARSFATPIPPSRRFDAIRSISGGQTKKSPSNNTAASTSMTTEEKKPPNFAPWDRNQFLDRLETFRHVDKWMSKPDPINEVQWAKRGWRCVGKETVGCVGGCGNEVVIALETNREEDQRPADQGDDEVPEEVASDDGYDWREEAQKELVQRYTEMIVTEHDEGCLWRRRGCDDTIHRLPLAHQSTTLSTLRQCYDSFTAISTALPSNISHPPDLNLKKITPHLQQILYPPDPKPSNLPSSPPPPQPSPTINHPALLLSLTGWQADTHSPVPGIATCTACFRRLGLWLYTTPPTSPLPSTSSPSSPTRVINHLDPLTEHRDYCPWINARAQARPILPSSNTQEKEVSLPGWMVLRDMCLMLRPPGGFSSNIQQALIAGVNGKGGENGTVDPGEGEGGEEVKSKEERDKERWARLKRLKQVFRVRRKPKDVGGVKG
ncbi:MAG: hypothetical protein Q9220_000457 [cf. Caloplaca sp. 1 TL-2023]